jgi:serine/threonine-protein kinase RsbW
MRLNLAAELLNLPVIKELVESAAKRAGLDARQSSQILLAAEEAAVNIIRHAYPLGPGELHLVCRVPTPGILELEFSDQGLPFDPLQQKGPNLTAGLVDRPVGGLGVPLIKANADQASYRREAGRNVLILRKGQP